MTDRSPAIDDVVGTIVSTQRLDLRWFTIDDADDLQRICNNKAVAATSGSLTFPYTREQAERVIEKIAKGVESGKWYCFALIERESGALIGDVSLHPNEFHAAELGYIIGEEHWGKGYATEAARAALDYAFETLGLRRVEGRCVTRHPPSARVMEKAGMTREGHLRESFMKWGVYFDDYIYGITRAEWEAQRAAHRDG